MTDPSPVNSTTRTRVATLTPMGAAGIAVIRLVGRDASRIARTVFRPVSGTNVDPHFTAGRIHFGQIVDGDEVIDDVVLTARFVEGLPWDDHDGPEPAGPDAANEPNLVEINPHGGVRVVQRIVMLLVERGAALGDREEIGLLGWPCRGAIEREAWAGMCQAQTHRAVLWLAHQQTVLPDALRRCIDRLNRDEPAARRDAAEDIDLLLSRYESARRLVFGAGIVIVGPPNAGKSTLANRLFGRPRSLVAEQPGTTRDWVAEPTAIEGIPVTLVDTAGLRETLNALERTSIRRGIERAASADLVLAVIDQSESLAPADRDMLLDLVRSHPTGRVLLVLNKCDLLGVIDGECLRELALGERVTISAATGEGMAVLHGVIARRLGLEGWTVKTPAPWTERQRSALKSIRNLLPDKPKKAAKMLSELVEKS